MEPVKRLQSTTNPARLRGMDLTNLYALSLVDATRLIRENVISSEQLVDACLARVREVDGDVQAWAFLDPEHALSQARAADRWKHDGNPLGPLHGVPVGIKDIIDTADMPTENGSVLHAGRTPSRDASVVARLRGAGAVMLAGRLLAQIGGDVPTPVEEHDEESRGSEGPGRIIQAEPLPGGQIDRAMADRVDRSGD